MEQIKIFLEKTNPGYYLYPISQKELEKECIFQDIDFVLKKTYICNVSDDIALKKEIIKMRIGLHDIYKIHQKRYEETGEISDLAIEFITRLIIGFLFFPNGMDKKHKIYMSTLIERFIYHDKFFEFNTTNKFKYSKNYRYITLNQNLMHCYEMVFNFEKVLVVFKEKDCVETLFNIDVIDKIQSFIEKTDGPPFLIAEWMLK